MTQTEAAYLLDRLDSTLAELEDARRRRDEGAEFDRCWLALEFLHSLDDAAKAECGAKGLDYLNTVRPKSPEGDAQAALTWFRDAVHHQRAAMKADFMRPVRHFLVSETGASVPIRKFQVAEDGSLVPLTMFSADVAWPDRSKFPPSNKKSHGRDILYDQHVAGRPLMPPLRSAQSFLKGFFF